MTHEPTFLTFALARTSYAVDARQIQEVVPLPELTPLIDVPPFVSGIFNLRGKIVTAVDLRQRMGLGRRPWDAKNAVLVVSFQEKPYGLIVDEALSLIQLTPQDIEPAPDLSSFTETPQSPFVFGAGKAEGRLIPILNLERVFTTIAPEALGRRQDRDDGKFPNPRP